MPPNEMDEECIALCNAINKIPGLRTTSSCCGHGKELFRIWFDVDNLKCLPILLYYCDPCHVGFRWNCLVTTDCGMSPVSFRLESKSMGEQSYGEAQRIANEVLDFLESEDYKEWNSEE